MSFTSVTLIGTVETEPGVPLSTGYIVVELSDEISDGTTDLIPTAQTAAISAAGTFSLAVVANNDLTTTPKGTTYRVQVWEGEGLEVDSFNVTVLTADAPTVDVFSLARS